MKTDIFRPTILCTAVLGLALILTTLPQRAFAEGESDDYDTIVNDLTNRNRSATISPRLRDPLTDSAIHAGLGFDNNFETVRSYLGRRLPLSQSGVQAAVGIDLFSPHWVAEGSASSFGAENVSNCQVDLHEFDLKILNKGHLSGALNYRVGGGITARYLNVDEPGQTGGRSKVNYVTPASVALIGGEVSFSEHVSAGLDGSYRSALISETIDHVAFDIALHVDAHF